MTEPIKRRLTLDDLQEVKRKMEEMDICRKYDNPPCDFLMDHDAMDELVEGFNRMMMFVFWTIHAVVYLGLGVWLIMYVNA